MFIGAEAEHGGADRFDLFRFDQLGGIGNDFAERTASGGNHRSAAGHGFDGREPEAFVKGGVNENMSGAIEIGKFGIGNEPEGTNVAGVRRLSDAGMNLLGAMPIAAAEREEPIGTGLAFELFESFNEADVVFGGMFEAGDVEEKGSVQMKTSAGEGARGFGIGREETVVFEAVVNDIDLGAFDAEETLDIGRGVVADGDDLVLTAGELLDDDLAVKHASRIVFAGDVERSEIVDGGDARTGRMPDEAAIAGDMQEVQAKLAGKARENGLVPKDIFDRGPKFFGDGDELEAITEAGEERAVFFEDEKFEFVGRLEAIVSPEQRKDILGDASFAALDDRSGEADAHYSPRR